MNVLLPGTSNEMNKYDLNNYKTLQRENVKGSFWVLSEKRSSSN